MRKTIWIAISMILLSTTLTGCAEQQFVVTEDFESNDQTTQLESQLKQEKYVERAVAMFAEKHLLVAVQLDPWQKWQKKTIESDLQQKYKKQYSSYDVLVSSDYKIYLELTKLTDKKDGDTVKTMKVLKDLAREET